MQPGVHLAAPAGLKRPMLKGLLMAVVCALSGMPCTTKSAQGYMPCADLIPSTDVCHASSGRGQMHSCMHTLWLLLYIMSLWQSERCCKPHTSGP